MVQDILNVRKDHADETKTKISVLIENGLRILSVTKDVQCSNCAQIPLFHYTFPCSHVYCRTCHGLYVSNKQKCRKCGTAVGNQATQDKKVELAIYNLQTICPNLKNGCKEIIVLQNVLDHMDNCNYKTKTLLPKLYTEAATYESNDEILDNHSNRRQEFEYAEKLEKVMTQLQIQSAENAEIRQRLEAVEAMTSSKSDDRMKQLESRLLGTNLKLTAVEGTLNALKLSVTQKLDYCDGVMRRLEKNWAEITNSLKARESVEEKVISCCDRIDKMEDALIKLESLVSRGQEMAATPKTRPDAKDAATKTIKYGERIWEINEFNKKKDKARASKDGKFALFSNEFYSAENGYKMKLQASFMKDELCLYLGFEPGENDANLPAVYHHRKTFYILDRSDGEDKRHVVKMIEPRFRDGQLERWTKKFMYAGANICTYQSLEGDYRDVYLKDDSIVLKVAVEPILPLARAPFSTDGILIWKLTNYERAKRESIDKIRDSLESESFYSSPGGYRIQCYLFFVEDGLNIWLYFLEGEFDDALPDVYPHRATFSILDQINRSGNSFHKVDTLDPKVIGITEAKEKMGAEGCSGAGFFYSSLEKAPFLVDDSILMRIDVKPL